MIRLLIADDHPIVRRGMAEIIAQESDLKVVGQAGTAAEVISILSENKADIVLLDLNMPGKHGLEAIKEIVGMFKNVKILIMSAYPEDQFAKRVLRAGASGYLSKDAAPDQLVNAIRKVSGGGRYVSAAIAEQLAVDLSPDFQARPHEALSDRELQVLLQLATGASVTEISELLSLSPKTVSTYRTRIMVKLKLKSNADLTRYALEQRLID